MCQSHVSASRFIPDIFSCDLTLTLMSAVQSHTHDNGMKKSLEVFFSCFFLFVFLSSNELEVFFTITIICLQQDISHECEDGEAAAKS